MAREQHRADEQHGEYEPVGSRRGVDGPGSGSGHWIVPLRDAWQRMARTRRLRETIAGRRTKNVSAYHSRHPRNAKAQLSLGFEVHSALRRWSCLISIGWPGD